MAANPSILLGAKHPEFIQEETLATLFKTTALQFPTKTALIFQNSSLTYAQLDQWSDVVAEKLIAHGISTNQTVGLWYPRGLELQVAILAIVKAGATYVPLDIDMPLERVETVLLEAKASVCFTLHALSISCEAWAVAPWDENIKGTSPLSVKYSSQDGAYILYTSGSTGKPKGIPISQKQICHLVRAEQSVLQIRKEDKVYQGFSVSFDMWCEETWISYFAGATLFIADSVTSKAIDELPALWEREKITVVHAVPSLLAVLEDENPSLRLLNAGGEACTQAVLNKWAKPFRTFYNSYGPTETTVTSSMIALQPADKITIGFPLPNYNYAVVDEQLQILPQGELGELVITGPCVGVGYIHLPELTAQKFVPNPHDPSLLPGTTIYKTGDAALIQPDGTVDFHGRIDDQIKLRGFRIELGEIESQLALQPSILAAAVAVKKDANGQEELVGYVVSKNNELDENLLRNQLNLVLPAYMIPNAFVLLKEMPRLPSGKINRKVLPLPASFITSDAPSTAKISVAANAPLSEKVLASLQTIFPGKKIDLSQDFFHDLSGHSLLAALFVSNLRKEYGAKNVSLKDIYLHRPLQNLVNTWEKKSTQTVPTKQAFNSTSASRYYLCWIAQTLGLFFIYGLYATQIFLPYLSYYFIQQETESHAYAMIAALALFCFIPPVLTGISVFTKWLVIGKYKAGEYPLWGSYYFRWWFVSSIQDLVQLDFISSTPLYPIYLKMLGVKIAPDAQLSGVSMGAEDLITIGKDVSISSGVSLNNVVIEDGLLKISSIEIGDHAYIGTASIIGGNTKIADWAEIKDMSYLQPNQTVSEASVWQGSPAVFVEQKQLQDLPKPLAVSEGTRFQYQLLFSFLLFIFPLAILIPLLPTIVALNELDNAADAYDFHYLIYTPLLALGYLLVFALQTIVLTRWLQKDIAPGKYPVYSLIFVKKWLADQFMSLSLMVMYPVYATVYIGGFFRALGAKVGAYTEISTASNVTHPLLEIGTGSFIADAVTLGEADVRAQQLILEKTVIGDRSFVGNSALIPQGYTLPSNMLIGVLSVPPTEENLQQSTAKNWFGSPSIAIPIRQESANFDESLTMKPSKGRFAARSFVELIRILIPETILLCCSILFIAYGHDLLIDFPLWIFVLLFPLYYLFFIGVPAFLVSVLLKWVLVGKYKPTQLPMWSWGVWSSEAVTAIYESLGVPFFLDFLTGTPWLPFFMRFFGVKIGQRVFMNTADITEFDMVSLGDDAALNDGCGPQTHLFEDRIMKIGAVKIGARTTIGGGSIILYDTEIGDDVLIEPLSLVMKGETLPPHSVWGGSPLKS